MMTNKSPKHYTEEFRTRAVERLRTGKPVSKLAEELCVNTDSLDRWRTTCLPCRVRSPSCAWKTTF